jgi:hypothetical protein
VSLRYILPLYHQQPGHSLPPPWKLSILLRTTLPDNARANFYRSVRLAQLKKKLAEQRKHLDELDKHMCVAAIASSGPSLLPLLTINPLQRRIGQGARWRAQLGDELQ